MKGREIMEICGSFRWVCIRDIADIPDISKIRAVFANPAARYMKYNNILEKRE